MIENINQESYLLVKQSETQMTLNQSRLNVVIKLRKKKKKCWQKYEYEFREILHRYKLI